MARVWYINWHFLDISYFFKVESSAKIEMQPRKLGYWKNLSTRLLQERGSVTRFWTRLTDQSVWLCFCCHRPQK